MAWNLAGVKPSRYLLQAARYQTANVTHMRERVVGTGKLELNFVSEGEMYQVSRWSEFDLARPFFAQFNLPEAEYDIHDRQSAD